MNTHTAATPKSLSRREKTLQLTQMGFLTALSLVLLMAIRIPLFPAAPFLIYDMADVAILIATFYIGMSGGIKVLFAVCFLQATFMSADGVVGFAMHFIATGTFVSLAYILNKRLNFRGSLAVALATGALGRAAVMILCNFIFTVHFYGVPLEVVNSLMIPVIIPFNLIVSFTNALIFFLIFDVVGMIFRRHGTKSDASSREIKIKS